MRCFSNLMSKTVRKKASYDLCNSQTQTESKKTVSKSQKHRKVEQLGCTDAELRQQCGVVADEPSTWTASSCEKLSPSSKKKLTKQYEVLRTAMKSFLLMHRTTRLFWTSSSRKRDLVDISELRALVRTLSCSQCKQDSLCLTVDTKRWKGLAFYATVLQRMWGNYANGI